MLIEPIIYRMIELKDQKVLTSVENLRKIVKLFDEIANLCKEIENTVPNKAFSRKKEIVSYFT